jgi:hypothetical protein
MQAWLVWIGSHVSEQKNALQVREPLNHSLRALLALKRVAARRVTQEMAIVLFK